MTSVTGPSCKPSSSFRKTNGTMYPTSMSHQLPSLNPYVFLPNQASLGSSNISWSPRSLNSNQSWSSFWEDKETTDYACIDINVNHPIKLTRLAIRALLGKDKKGVVCLVSSIAGINASIRSPLYCASKHAIWGFVKSMTMLDQLEGVKVTSICPGYFIPFYPSSLRFT